MTLCPVGSPSAVVADAPPNGYAIPLDVHAVDARAYARVTANRAFRRYGARQPVLWGGRVLLSETSARCAASPAAGG